MGAPAILRETSVPAEPAGAVLRLATSRLGSRSLAVGATGLEPAVVTVPKSAAAVDRSQVLETVPVAVAPKPI